MKNLKNLTEKLNNCSRCGLCQAVCPVYEITKNDCTSPKGKCIMLKQLLNSNKKPSKKIKQYMQMCTNCGKCFDYCPSKIDIININNAYKKDFYNETFKKILEYYMKICIFLRTIIVKLKNWKIKKGSVQINKILYIKPYTQKEIPYQLKKRDIYVIDCLNCDLEFIIKNPKIARLIFKNDVIKKINEKGCNCIVTDDFICKLQIEENIDSINSPIKLMCSSDL